MDNEVKNQEVQVAQPATLQMSPEFDKLFDALAKCQGDPNWKVEKTKSAGKPNDKWHYKYADYADVLLKCLPIMSKQGLSLTQFIHGDFWLSTVIAKGGQFIRSTIKMPEKETVQDQGQVITYYKRYAMGSALAIAMDEDLDMNPNNSNGSSPSNTGESKPDPFSNKSKGKDKGKGANQDEPDAGENLVAGRNPTEIFNSLKATGWHPNHVRNHVEKHWNEYMARMGSEKARKSLVSHFDNYKKDKGLTTEPETQVA